MLSYLRPLGASPGGGAHISQGSACCLCNSSKQIIYSSCQASKCKVQLFIVLFLGMIWYNYLTIINFSELQVIQNNSHYFKVKLILYVCVCVCVCTKSLQSCLTLCDPRDCSPPGSSVHGIFQARILEWIAVPCFRGSSQPRDRTYVSYISYIGRWVLYH